MNIEQWANETEEILSYWHKCPFVWELNKNNKEDFENCVFFRIIHKENAEYVASFIDHKTPLEAALYLTNWFGKLEMPF